MWDLFYVLQCYTVGLLKHCLNITIFIIILANFRLLYLLLISFIFIGTYDIIVTFSDKITSILSARSLVPNMKCFFVCFVFWSVYFYFYSSCFWEKLILLCLSALALLLYILRTLVVSCIGKLINQALYSKT